MPQFLYWNSIKPFALTATVLAVTSLMNVQIHAASEHKASYYQVQTGTLTQALNNVAQQANVSVLFNPTRTNLYQVKTIQGQYTLDQLFERLIQNTPFKLGLLKYAWNIVKLAARSIKVRSNRWTGHK